MTFLCRLSIGLRLRVLATVVHVNSAAMLLTLYYNMESSGRLRIETVLYVFIKKQQAGDEARLNRCRALYGEGLRF